MYLISQYLTRTKHSLTGNAEAWTRYICRVSLPGTQSLLPMLEFHNTIPYKAPFLDSIFPLIIYLAVVWYAASFLSSLNMYVLLLPDKIKSGYTCTGPRHAVGQLQLQLE